MVNNRRVTWGLIKTEVNTVDDFEEATSSREGKRDINSEKRLNESSNDSEEKNSTKQENNDD